MWEVGCALSVCRPEQIYSIDTKGDACADGQGSQILNKVFMLVCVYGAGFPGDADLDNYYLYAEGVPCSECCTDRLNSLFAWKKLMPKAVVFKLGI